VLSLVLAAITLAALPVPAQNNDDNLAATLRAKDQALLDAYAPGDRAVWESTISDDFFYADENNRVIPRADYLREFQALPNGASGHIVIKSWELHRSGDTAIVVHKDNEFENYFGSDLFAQYLMTETWQLLGGAWKLRAVHCAAIPADPPAIHLTTVQMDELAGTYQAGTLTYVIRRDQNRLLGARPGHSETELKAETRDVLFVPGQPRSRKVFARDAAEKVTGFADRRENRDLVWHRIQ
jgi:hypothetical protein